MVTADANPSSTCYGKSVTGLTSIGRSHEDAAMQGAGLDGHRGDMPGRGAGPADGAAAEVSNLLLPGRPARSRGVETARRDGPRGSIRRSRVVRHTARRDPDRPKGASARS